MPLIAEDLIDEARDFHESFSAQRQPPTVLLRALARAERRFFDLVTEIAEGALATEQVYDAAAIATARAGTPLTVPSHRKILQAIVGTDAGLYGCEIIQDERSGRPFQFWARLIGRSLYIAQPSAVQAELASDFFSGSAWEHALLVRLTYVPAPGELADLTDPLSAPDDARDYLVGRLVAFMAGRAPSHVGDAYPRIVKEAEDLQAGVLALYEGRAANETDWYVGV